MKLKKDQIAPWGKELLVIQTGDWRSERPILNPRKCNHCGQCWIVCPTFCIHAREGVRLSDRFDFLQGLWFVCEGMHVWRHPHGARAERVTMRQVLNGNKSAAYGAKLCRPEIMAVYPITPQTTVSEYLCQFKANGELDSTIVEAESEHSVMSILTGASMAGSRVFTATSGQGLLYMCEPYVRVSTCRLPIVMCIVNREVISPTTVWCGHQDAITLRDGGWIQIFVENNQEILDTVIMAFKIAEDPEVMLPVNVCYDGFYLSHMVDIVEVPDQEVVDRFLPSYQTRPARS